MKSLSLLIIVIGLAGGLVGWFKNQKQPAYGAPAYDSGDPGQVSEYQMPDFYNWKRPPGPYRVGLQAGHWKNAELPDELEKIRGNSGASSLGVAEWQVNLNIAEATAKILRAQGIEVDILPATVPPRYLADVFVAIHADGSTTPATAGFKVAGPRRDLTGKANKLVKMLEENYGRETGMVLDPNVSRNMRGYYAFSWWRFEHAVHPMTPAVILETGFLTNPAEAELLVNRPEVPAGILARVLTDFLKD